MCASAGEKSAASAMTQSSAALTLQPCTRHVSHRPSCPEEAEEKERGDADSQRESQLSGEPWTWMLVDTLVCHRVLTFKVACMSALTSVDSVCAAVGGRHQDAYNSRLGGVPGGRSGSVSLPLPTSTAVQVDMVSWRMLL